jgi:hypothetical protein
VVTIKVHSDRLRLTFQLWEVARRDFDATRSESPRQAQMTQEAIVTLENSEPVANGSLRVSFSKLLERPPTPATAEGDFVFTEEDLVQSAKSAWENQEMAPQA